MPKIQYISKRFNSSRIETIRKANEIIADYARQGFELTLRQLYYQFVSRNLFPTDRFWSMNANGKWVRDLNGTPNAEPNYKWLGETINEARLAGLVDWDAIVDRTRYLRGLTNWDSPEDIVGGCASGYHLDHWKDQPYHVEVWIEKDALIGVISGVCNKNDVGFFSCRGYTSQSEVWRAARRLRYYAEDKKKVLVLHLGDHDPSGIDMSRDMRDRLELFAPGADITLNRIALNMPQVQQYNPPPNPAKETDSRCDAYVRLYGEESWELDALEPSVIVTLIQSEVDKVLDKKKWDAVCRRERKDKDLIGQVAANWPAVRDFVKDK